MPKPTNRETVNHNAFLRRQKTYENKYQVSFFRYFDRVYRTAAQTISKEGVDAYRSKQLELQHTGQLDAIYSRLYNDVTITEAKIEFRLLNPLESTEKDLIDDIVEQFPFRGGSTIRLFRQLLQDYLVIRVGARITQVTGSTVRYVAEVIEKGIAEGLSAQQIARLLRRQTDFNRNRALMVARTETVTASNQGKFMSASSSNLLMEKRWIPTNQPGRTRPSHLAMLNSKFIDIDQPFFISNSKGGIEQARYPGDETLSAENTVNCRCSLGFRVKRDKDGNPIRKIF